jgi:exonuclease SbcC
MLDVVIENFQSIERINFRIDGFGAFVGRSNIGKSAVVRALRCALTGATGTDFVRHGPSCERRVRGLKKCKCQATVRVALPELTFTWEKGDAVNQYTVQRPGVDEPEVYSKIDRGTPDFLLPLFNPVKVGTGHELLQVSEQFSPIFLLDQGGNTVADVLSDVAQLDEINVAMGLVSKDRKNALATRTVREKDILALETSLEKYDGLDDAISRVREVEGRHEAVEGAQEAAQQLDGYLTTLRGLAASIKALKAATAPSIPKADPLAEGDTKLSQLDKFYREVAGRATVVRRLRGVEKVVVPDDTAMRATLGKLSQVEGWLDQLRKFKVALRHRKKLEGLPTPDGDALEQAQQRYSTAQGLADRQAQLKATIKRCEELEAVPTPSEVALEQAQQRYDTLHEFADRLERLEGAQVGLGVELAAIETEEQEILEAFSELGVCPACSQSIEADHCLSLEGL